MAKKETNEVIHLYNPDSDLKIAKVSIVGDSPLIISKYTRGTIQELSDKQKGVAAKGRKNVQMYQEAIEKIHWLHSLPPVDEMVYDEDTLNELLKTNVPCIPGVSIWKAVLSTITRCGFDNYSTKAKATFRVCEDKIPISFSRMEIEEKIIPSQVGKKPILNYRPVFYDWSAEFTIKFTTDVYSAEQIFAFINQSGFSNGIGSNRPGTSGTNGMFHILT